MRMLFYNDIFKIFSFYRTITFLPNILILIGLHTNYQITNSKNFQNKNLPISRLIDKNQIVSNANLLCNCNIYDPKCIWYCQNIYSTKGWLNQRNTRKENPPKKDVNNFKDIFNQFNNISIEFTSESFLPTKSIFPSQTNFSTKKIKSIINPLISLYKSKNNTFNTVVKKKNKFETEKEICDFVIFLKKIEKETNGDEKNLLQNIIYKYFKINNLNDLECTLDENDESFIDFLEGKTTESDKNTVSLLNKDDNTKKHGKFKFSKIYYTSIFYIPDVSISNIFTSKASISKVKSSLSNSITMSMSSKNKQDSLIKANELSEKRNAINKELDSAEVSIASSINKVAKKAVSTKYIETTSFVYSTPYYTLNRSILNDSVKTVTVTYYINDKKDDTSEEKYISSTKENSTKGENTISLEECKNKLDLNTHKENLLSSTISLNDCKKQQQDKNDFITIDDFINEVKNSQKINNTTIKELIKQNLNELYKEKENFTTNSSISQLKSISDTQKTNQLSNQSSLIKKTTILTTIFITKSEIEKTFTKFTTTTVNFNIESKIEKILFEFENKLKNIQPMERMIVDKMNEIDESNNLKNEQRIRNLLKSIKLEEKDVKNNTNFIENAVSQSSSGLPNKNVMTSTFAQMLSKSEIFSNTDQKSKVLESIASLSNQNSAQSLSASQIDSNHSTKTEYNSSKSYSNTVTSSELKLFSPLNLTSIIENETKKNTFSTKNCNTIILKDNKNTESSNINPKERILITKTIELDDQNNLEIKISQDN